MYTLRIDSSWSHQIAAIRDANSYDTGRVHTIFASAAVVFSMHG
jgi:hypothetical protein